MDKIVQIIQGLSNDNDLNDLKKQLKNYEDSIHKNGHLIDEVLNSILDPNAHSLGYLYLLHAKCSMRPHSNYENFILQVSRFFTNCNPKQVRMAPEKFTEVARKFSDSIVEAQQPLKAILPLREAIRRFRPSKEHLTPLHADLMQVALLAKNYSAALPILEEPIYVVDPETTCVTPRDLLRYFYYGGMVYVGLKQFSKALEFFQQAFAAPAHALSAIMVEGYKKYILVSLLVHGQVNPVPKFTSSVAQRHLKSCCAPYLEFANAYSNHSTEELHKVASGNSELFTKEHNFGLIKQCIQSLYRRNIQRLTQTYLTLSLRDIADAVKLTNDKEAERYILRMIQEGEIFATINQRDGMVSFKEDPEQYNSNYMLRHLDGQIHKNVELAEKVTQVDEYIASSPIYIQRTQMHDRSGRWDQEEAIFEMGEKGARGGKTPIGFH